MHLVCALRRKLIAKLQYHALGGFLANPWDPGQPRDVVSKKLITVSGIGPKLGIPS